MKSKTAPDPANRPSVGRPKDAAKGEGIIRAATALFMRDGYELTSMEAVAKKADVSKLTIYSHFANKDELFKAVIRQRCDKLATPECFLTQSDQPVEPALLDLALRLAGLIFSADSIRLHRVVQAEATRHPKVVQIFYEAGPRRVREAFGALLQEWNRRGQLNVPDIPVATEQFFSLLKGERLMRTMLLREPMPNAGELDKHVRATVKLFLDAYRPKTPLSSK
ncbi:MAG: TetR/AcrR family transcriptional regulator [Pseudomonadota bacterium]|nr:TetR/AcrR family transcriptional regulator [Pseudomonadota bacterium]